MSINYTEFLLAQREYDAAQCDMVGGTEFGAGTVYSAQTQTFLATMGMFIMLMQPGFAMLEAGSTGSTAVTSILFKNFLDCSLGAVVWFTVGYAFAFGSSHDQFIGNEGFFTYNVGKCNYAHWFFQLAFATTASTIVSGAIAGRTKLSAYLCHTVCMLGWVYPTVVHWVWGPDPWLANEGFRDFAGSGVVHIVGGTTALTAAYWVGPRGTAKFENFRKKRDIPAHSIVLVALGTFLLFIGFIAFNGGSVQAVDTVLETAILARAIINTCLAMGGGGLATVFFSRKIARNKYWSFRELSNGAISGMVSVCAGANAFEPWAAFFTGVVAGIVYRSMSMLVCRFNIDDAVDAGAVHMGAGMWGVIANSLLNNHDSVFKDNHGISAWDRLAWALCGIIVIGGWAAVWMNMLFFALYRLDMLRVSDEDIETGIDLVEHGESGYVWTALAMDSRHPQGPARLAAKGMYSTPFSTGASNHRDSAVGRGGGGSNSKNNNGRSNSDSEGNVGTAESPAADLNQSDASASGPKETAI